MTDNKGEEVVLEKIFCIHYLVWFQESQEQVRALLDSGNKVNTMSSAYVEKLDLKTWKIIIGVQKIDGSALETFGMVIANFHLENKGGRPRFFQEIFLVTNTKFGVILGMLFLKLSNVDMLFRERTLT